jgi:hypothetical protein
MSEIGSKLREIETPLCDARDLVEAARMAAADLEDDGQRTALQAVLETAYDKLGTVKKLYYEAHELAVRRTKPDPIFAAIEAHREAYKAYRAAVEAVKRPSQVNRLAVDDDEANPAAAEDKTSDEAAVKLTTTRPETFEGVMALLDYFAEMDVSGNYVFPSSGRDGDEESAFAGCVVRNAVRALRETVED